MTKLLYFKGTINNKSIDIELTDNKDITSDFVIILSMMKGE